MIVDFSVSNFRSIKGEQTLSLSATNLREKKASLISLKEYKKVKLLRAAIIYGANASGKSNLLRAIEQLLMMVLLSTDLKLESKIPSYQPYRLDKACSEGDVKFEIEFICYDSLRYRYKVEFSENEIKKEELYFYPKSKEALLFSRLKGKPINYGSHFRGKRKNIEDELLKNNLFLSKAANSNHEQLREVYLYFLDKYLYQGKDDLRSALTKARTTKGIAGDDHCDLRRQVQDFLIAADTGISSLDIKKKEFTEEGAIPEDMPKFLKSFLQVEMTMRPTTSHKLYDGENEVGFVEFDLDEESDGTKKIYSIALDIIETLRKGGVYVIDEIDNSLHPHITYLILSMFNDPEINKKNAQLICATHDSSLLNSKIMRRDQIWFTKKNRTGSTELYSLVEFDKNLVRENTPFADWYLSGKFEAVPVIDKSIRDILSCD